MQPVHLVVGIALTLLVGVTATPSGAGVGGQESELQWREARPSESSTRAVIRPDYGRWSGEYTDETGVVNFTVAQTKKYRRANVRTQVYGYMTCNGRRVGYNLEGYSRGGWKIGYSEGDPRPVGGFGFSDENKQGRRLWVYVFTQYMSHRRAKGYVRINFQNDPDFGDCELYSSYYATHN